MVTKSASRPGIAIVRKKLKRHSVGEISEILDIDPTHVYNVDRRGVSPTLHEALIEAGWVEPPPKVYTVAFHLSDESAAAALRRIFDAHGDTRAEIAGKFISGELRIVESE